MSPKKFKPLRKVYAIEKIHNSKKVYVIQKAGIRQGRQQHHTTKTTHTIWISTTFDTLSIADVVASCDEKIDKQVFVAYTSYFKFITSSNDF